jgi:hypothetical protein
MPRKKKASVSMKKLIETHRKSHPRDGMTLARAEVILEPEAAVVPIATKEPSPNVKAVLESMVRKRVDEILTASGIGEFEPNFRRREVAKASRQSQDMFERVKWSLYFEKWGCQVCGKKTVAHMHTGHCTTCAVRIGQRLTKIKRDYERAHPEAEIDRQIDQLTLRARTAESLLRRSEE